MLSIPAVRGMRFGTMFATTLAILSMIPLTFLAIAWIFNPSVVDFGSFRVPAHQRQRLLLSACSATGG